MIFAVFNNGRGWQRFSKIDFALKKGIKWKFLKWNFKGDSSWGLETAKYGN